jgi:hypothetical protein
MNRMLQVYSCQKKSALKSAEQGWARWKISNKKSESKNIKSVFRIGKLISKNIESKICR